MNRLKNLWPVLLLLVVVLYFALKACRRESPAPVREEGGAGNLPVEVFFTRSGEHPDRKLVSFIRSAKRYVHMAIFELELDGVVEALIDAKRRGLDVAVVMDDRMKRKWAAKRLKEAGIPVVFDNREPYMHNKFVVVDGKAVWSGSMNFKESSVFRNDNNAFIIYSPAVAQNYEKEFQEMFRDRLFGPESPRNTHCCFKVAGNYLENYFAPEDSIARRIVQLIRDAKRSVRFAAFSFTDDDIGKAIADAHRRGLKVVGVIEARSVRNKGSEYRRLRRAGVEVYKDGNPYIMHNKYIIIDDSIVITGSYNFSTSARKRNDENVVIFFTPSIAERYIDNFNRILREALSKMKR
ncbi:MAG: phospholipase [Thermotogae bacterium]|nr:phospholipase [Thermotogota bacterium]